MMQIVALFVMLCGITAGYSTTAQNAYFQQPMGYRTIQRDMYGLKFRNQQFRNQRVSNFDPGMHPIDCQHTVVDSAALPIQEPNVEPVADAYPSEQFPIAEDPIHDVPAVYEDESEEPLDDEVSASPSVPATVPEKKKNKVSVQADSDEEEDQDADGDNGSNDSASSNAFFPVNFGGANGGAIAIANSYSTGKGGSATSTSTAYGSPSTSELRRTTLVQLRKRPATFRGRQSNINSLQRFRQ